MMNVKNEKTAYHYEPEKFGRLNKPVVVLRKVNTKRLDVRATADADTAMELIGKGQVQLHLREDSLPWLAQGYVINDQPRDEKVARDIVKATIGFALARTDTGEIMKKYGADGLGEAEADARSVKLTMSAAISHVEEERDDHETLVAAYKAETTDSNRTEPETA